MSSRNETYERFNWNSGIIAGYRKGRVGSGSLGFRTIHALLGHYTLMAISWKILTTAERSAHGAELNENAGYTRYVRTVNRRFCAM